MQDRSGPGAAAWMLPALALLCAVLALRLLHDTQQTLPRAWSLLSARARMSFEADNMAAAVGLAVAVFVVVLPIAWCLQRLPRHLAMAAEAMLCFPAMVLVLAWVFALLLSPGAGAASAAIAFLPGKWLRLLTLLVPPFALWLSRAWRRVADPAAMRAAATLGHDPWRAFRSIVLPGIAPVLAVGALLALLAGFSAFGNPAGAIGTADGAALAALAAAVAAVALALCIAAAVVRTAAIREPIPRPRRPSDG